METNGAAPLRDVWYFALPGFRLPAGTMVGKTILDEPILFGRDGAGQVFALKDICPHRGIPLSCGGFDGKEVECRYHGWRFRPTGACAAIPSLVPDQEMDLTRIEVPAYPVREVQGNIWVFIGEDQQAAPEIPLLPDIGDRGADLHEEFLFPAPIDHAVIGLMDPAHGPFVHRGWWWRTAASIHEKAKAFGPSPWGFTMLRHAPSRNSRAYRILGGERSTEISFRLPGVRIEHIKAGRHTLINLTAITPVSAAETEVHHLIYWTLPWLSLVKPLLRPVVRMFLNQDRRVVVQQQRGLKHNPSLLLINDADTQAKWYYRLKQEYVRSRAEKRPFENPVTERVLRWRS